MGISIAGQGNGDIKDVIQGSSVGVGAQVNPDIGASVTANKSGILVGPTVGVPGLSATFTRGYCFDL
jgi:hypothetical protein